MDSETFKLMLESQERAFKAALDTVVNQMTGQINKLENIVSDLKASLEFSQHEVDGLKSKTKELEKERKEDKTVIEKLVLKVKDLEDKVTYQEDYSRRKNLRITGLEEQSSETWEQTTAAVTSLLESKLQLPGVILERAHRIGPLRDSKPRTVVARFTRYSDRDAAIRRGSHLKGSNIYLNEDLSAASLAIKNAQMPRFKQARADGKIAYFRHTKLIIREKLNNDTAGRGRSTEDYGAVGGGVQDGARSESMAVMSASSTRGMSDPPLDDNVAVRGRSESASGTSGARMDAAAGVVHVEAAGVWTGRDNTRSSLSLPSTQHSGSRKQSASPTASSPAASSSQQRDNKKGLRSGTRR